MLNFKTMRFPTDVNLVYIHLYDAYPLSYDASRK